MSRSESCGQGIFGVGFFGLLGLLFVALKLCHVIDWSWWLVLLPLYGPAAFVGVVVTALLLALLVGGFCGRLAGARTRRGTLLGRWQWRRAATVLYEDTF